VLAIVMLFALPAGDAWASKGVDGVVNLNTAPPEALSLLPGVGPSKAAAIVAYRRRRPFRTVDELVRIKGIGRKMVRRLRPHLAVAGPTTAAAGAVKPGAGGPMAPPKQVTPPVHPANAARCPPPRPLARTPRPAARDRWPEGPFSSPCLGPR
jgi:competence ComEA-like helix-hairpin-helix protein